MKCIWILFAGRSALSDVIDLLHTKPGKPRAENQTPSPSRTSLHSSTSLPPTISFSYSSNFALWASRGFARPARHLPQRCSMPTIRTLPLGRFFPLPPRSRFRHVDFPSLWTPTVRLTSENKGTVVAILGDSDIGQQFPVAPRINGF